MMKVYNGQQYGGQAGMRIIRNQDEWQTLSRQLGDSLPSRLPAGQMGILISMGSVPCHEAIDIRHVSLEDQKLVVHVQRFDGGSHMGRSTITQPWAMAIVPATDREIVERDFEQLTKAVLARPSGPRM